MQLFYSDHIQQQHIFLDGEEAGHAIRVLRKKVGDEMAVTNGKGYLFDCRIADISRHEVKLDIVASGFQPPRKKQLHIAIAPTKNTDRFEWFLEKACEFGIEEVTPLLCNRSERKLIKHERLEKILIAGMKQSLHLHLPQLHEMTDLKSFLVNCEKEQTDLFMAHCLETEKLHLSSSANKKITVLIGPEGDFTSEEITLAAQHQFKSLSLGKSRLRTETAGIAVAHEVAMLIGE